MLEEALKKLEHPEKVAGYKEQVMAPSVAAQLRSFCDQDSEFAQAVAQGGGFGECMKAVARGTGGAISDLDAYKRAVQFYFPGAEIRVQMTIDLVGSADAGGHTGPHPTAKEEKPTGILLNLEDFL